MIRSLKPLVAILLAVVQGTDILIIFFRFTHCYFVCSFCWPDFYDFRRIGVTEEEVWYHTQRSKQEESWESCKRIGVLVFSLLLQDPIVPIEKYSQALPGFGEYKSRYSTSCAAVLMLPYYCLNLDSKKPPLQFITGKLSQSFATTTTTTSTQQIRPGNLGTDRCRTSTATNRIRIRSIS